VKPLFDLLHLQLVVVEGLVHLGSLDLPVEVDATKHTVFPEKDFGSSAAGVNVKADGGNGEEAARGRHHEPRCHVAMNNLVLGRVNVSSESDSSLLAFFAEKEKTQIKSQ
jgi:hypothetical protein